MRMFRVLFMTTLILISTMVHAGAVKELVIEHEESIENEVAMMGPFSVDKIFQTRFVQAKEGYEVAVESQVEVVENKSFQMFEIACTSQFKKGQFGSMDLFETNCEFPE